MAGITLIRPPSLGSPVIGAPGSITSQGTRRRSPSRISMSFQSHHQGKKVPANLALRAVHTPAPMPVLGNSSRSSRGPRKNNIHHIIPRATVDFRNTLIVMTSNIGGAAVVAAGGHGASYGEIRELVGEEMRRRFRPEFLNRLDETVVFRQLARAEVKEIAGILLGSVAARVRRKGVELQVTEGFKERVVEEGFDTSYGVRLPKKILF